MEKTPMAMRKHVAIFGDTNVGKSTLFNKLLGQEAAIVSDVSGTTTDPVTKAMELIPYGPIALIDTAGLGDRSVLGEQREAKTLEIIKRTDLILYVQDVNCENVLNSRPIDKNIPTIFVFTKCDLANAKTLNSASAIYPDSVLVFDYNEKSMDSLRNKIIEELTKQERDDETLIGKLLPKDSSLVLVCPIDSEAPKGRLIQPQVQLIRDCLDHNMKAYVTNEITLSDAVIDLKHVDLVVTDSQAFKQVDKIVPKEIKLTSFSMLLAYQKGNFRQLLDGASAIDKLGADSKVLVLEGCTHNTSHEDIGKVKIPALIKSYLKGITPEYEFYTGYNLPGSFSDYDLIIQCGMCMVNKKEVVSRLKEAESAGVPATNYGIALAKLSGILDRACEIFAEEE